MRSIYIASVEHFSGKTALCLGLGKHLQKDGYKVGYLKPLSLQPWTAAGHTVDEDAAFVKEALNLKAEAWELSPVVLTANFLREQLTAAPEINLLEKVKTAFDAVGAGQDIVLLEGGSSLREGYTVGLATPEMPAQLDSRVLLMVKYNDDVSVLDDTLASADRLGEHLGGVLLNRVPAQAEAFAMHTLTPYLERHGVPVLGVLPETRYLAALTVGELVDVLGAELLTRYYRPQAVVENLTVGAMTAEAAMTRFRQQSNKAVITGGDRADIQMAALETSTTCLILTGNIPPSPLVVKQAEEFGVAVMLAPRHTMETIDLIEGAYGKTRLGHPAKLRQFQALLEKHFDFGRCYEIFGVGQ
jgi:BioD-like phosphotransacetylase family protein